MTKRGPKPGSVQEGSLASKLLNIRACETIGIEDSFVDACGDQIKGASVMERSVQNLIRKNLVLKQRKFTTRRTMAVGGVSFVQQMLLITRMEDE